MASPQRSEQYILPKRIPAARQLDRRIERRPDNVFTRIEDATYAVLRKHKKLA